MGSKGIPCPAATALPAGYVESVCRFMVFAGLLTRLPVVALTLILILAILMLKWKEGFADGWAWPSTLTVVGIVLLVPAPGAISLDALLGLA